MRDTISYQLNAVGFTPWIPLSYIQPTFNASWFLRLSSNATGVTFSAQYAVEDLNFEYSAVGVQATTTLTLNFAPAVSANQFNTGQNPINGVNYLSFGHNLIVGDVVFIKGSAQAYAAGATNIDGFYPVATVVDQNNVTVTVVPSQSATFPNLRVGILRPYVDTNMSAKTANAQSGVVFPIQAVRGNLTAITTGYVSFSVLQGLGT